MTTPYCCITGLLEISEEPVQLSVPTDENFVVVERTVLKTSLEERDTRIQELENLVLESVEQSLLVISV